MSTPDLEKNIGALLENAAARHGDKTLLYVAHEGVSYSFKAFNARVNQFANALRQAGIQPRQHVGVMLPNCSEFPFTWLALAKLGAVMVPLNTRAQVVDLAYLLDDSEATALVIHTAYLPVYRAIAPPPIRIQTVLCVGPGDGAPGLPLGPLASRMPTALEPANPSWDDVMNLQYTSGTTGLPKAAVTTHEYWLLLGQFAAGLMSGQDVFLALSPFYYMDPQWELLMSLSAGSALVLVDKITIENLLGCLKRYPVTCTWAFEEMLYLPPLQKGQDHHLRLALLSAFPPARHQELEARFQVVAREVYGSTEIGAGTLVAPEDAQMVGSGSVGKPPGFRSLRIVDADGHDVPCGTAGELWVAGRGLFRGYYRKPEANARAFAGEYFRTGDLFRQDANGYYYFVGRQKDMIRRSGDNISAAEVEHVLMGHPKIAEAAVVPVPDKSRGEEVKAYIRPAPGDSPATIPPEAVIAYCLERIAKFKVPRYIEYVDDFPRSTSDKIQKHVLIGAKPDLTQGCYDRFGER